MMNNKKDNLGGTGKIWVTSDTHFHHKNIVKGCSEWVVQEPESSHRIQKVRNFKSLEEHDNQLITNFNKLIAEDDILYHLGDWSFGGIESIWNFRKMLRCRTIHLIYGNHDEKIEADRELPNTGELRSAQSLFNSVAHYKEITINKQKICMSHYSMRVWNKAHKGAIMLYGHSHGTLPEETNRKSMDVGVDTNDLKPYLLNDIIEKLNKRSVINVDHHTEATN